MIRQISIATLSVVCLIALSASAQAQSPYGNSPNPLFSQYVTQGAGTPSAAMYPAPHYSTMLGGQAYYTYQPLMPHEMMYQHSRNYYNYYNTGGYYGGGNALNKTSVRWQAGASHVGPLPFSTGLAGLHYRLAARHYCLDGNCDGGRRHHFRHRGVGCASGNCGTTGYVGGYAGETCAPVADSSAASESTDEASASSETSEN